MSLTQPLREPTLLQSAMDNFGLFQESVSIAAFENSLKVAHFAVSNQFSCELSVVFNIDPAIQFVESLTDHFLFRKTERPGEFDVRVNYSAVKHISERNVINAGIEDFP